MTSLATLLQPEIEILPHQYQTRDFLLTYPRAYNLSSCGSGKTLGCVLALVELWKAQLETRIVVIAPVSVIPSTWVEHMERFAPDVPVLMLNKSSNRRKLVQSILTFKGVVLINPDGLEAVIHELVAWRPGLLIIDELSGYYRNIKTNRWKAASFLVYRSRPAIWAFTGTPITKNLMDAYAQCLLVNPTMFPPTRSGKPMKYVEFRNMLMTNPKAHIWLPKQGAIERVKEIMQPAIRFTREQVMGDIKTPIIIRKQIPLSKEQEQLMKVMMELGKAQYGGQHINAKEARSLITKALQICMGEVYAASGETVSVPAGPRFQALMDVFDEVEQTPMIVAVNYIHCLLSLAEKIRLQGYRVAVIYGKVTPTERGEIIKAFQAGEIDFLLAHPQTLAHGVTLTRSSTVVWYGPIYDLELVSQLNDRIFRYGQKGQPLIVEFESTAIERRVYASLRGKQQLSGSFMELFGE